MLPAVVPGVVGIAEQVGEEECLAVFGSGDLIDGKGEVGIEQVSMGLSANAELRAATVMGEVGEFGSDGLTERGTGEIPGGVMPAIVVMGVEGDPRRGGGGTDRPDPDLAGV